MSSLITIVVPVFNVEEYLDFCVKSIVNQTYKELEILLIDDGSTDKSGEMCDQWSLRDSRIRVIHKANGGLSDARNAGLAVASGKFIGFVDSDDWIAPEMFERLFAVMSKDGSDIGACSVKMIWPETNISKMLTVSKNLVINRSEAQEALLNETLLKQPVWYKLYKREVIAGILFEKGKYHEDVYWSYRVFGNARKISLIDYTGYYYRQRNSSIMGVQYSLKRLDAIEAYCARYSYISKEFPELSKIARRSILTNCIYHTQMALKYLSGYDQEYALDYLNKTAKQYPLKRNDYADMKWSHQIWLMIGSHSIKTVARIKNYLNIGL